jgi:transcriptional regulator with XRE-family HTH domain
MLGMSQEKLATALNLTFQQVQKYENGTNRVGASRMQSIADVLGVPVSFFFEGAPSAASADTSGHNIEYITEFISSSEGLAIALAFSKIKDARIKRRLVELVEALTA